MRGKLIAMWFFVVLAIVPTGIPAVVSAESTASVTVTVSVRPPKVSLDIRAHLDQKLPPTRFTTKKPVVSTLFTLTEPPVSPTFATLLGTLS